MGKKVKVVFDTNVWISISLKKTLNDEFSHLKQEVNVYVSSEIILEISKVLLYPKTAEILRKNAIGEKALLRAIIASSKIVEPKMKLNVINKDAENNKILECALAAGADFIITGDKHLLELGKFRKIRTLTPRGFFDSLT